MNQIIFIESDLRKLFIHTNHEIIPWYCQLNKVENLLKEEGFVRIHQSYLVALDKVEQCNGEKLVIAGQELPVSRKYRDDVLERYGKMNALSMYQDSAPDEHGKLTCVKGVFEKAVLVFAANQEIIIGRDYEVAEIVLPHPLVSRVHCSIIFHSETGEYELCDMSRNGTFVGKERLIYQENYRLCAGDEISFGDKDTVFLLG